MSGLHLGPGLHLSLSPTSLALGKGGFSLDAFMAAQSDGLFNRFTLTDRLFQENTGPTPADDPGEVIGFAMSERAWSGKTLAEIIAAATELSHVDVATTAGTVTDNGDGTYTLGANSAARFRFNVASLESGATYRVGFNITGIGATSLGTDLADTSTATFTTTGAKSYYGRRDVYDSVYRFVDVTSGSGGGTITPPKLRKIPGKHGAQATLSFRPKYQSGGGALFDGNDDNLPTPYRAGAGGNFIAAKATIPATIPATQIIMGTQDAGPANRFWLGVDPDGRARGGVGSVNNHYGTSDLRGRTVAIGLSIDGTEVRLFVDDARELTAAQSGSATAAAPISVGACNSGGSPVFLFGGIVHSLVAGREFIDVARFKQIASKL